MRSRALLTCLSMLMMTVCIAQTASIKGHITVADMNIPISNVLVHVVENQISVITMADGTFEINALPTGHYTLEVSCLGFNAIREDVLLTERDLELQLTLEESIFTLPTATIREGSITGGLQKIRSLPGSAYYLPARELHKFQNTDINRVLAQVPGVNIQEEDGFGLRPNIGLRGSGAERSSKITLMEDGVLAAPAPYSAPSAYYFPTMGRMHAVEIVKGASQIKYGPFTTGGALNMISSPIPNALSATVKLLGGSHGNRNIRASLGNSHERIAYFAETMQYRSDGFKHVLNGATGFDKKDYLAKLRLSTRPDAHIFQALTIKAAQTHEVSDETYLGLTDSDFTREPYLRYAASQNDEMRSRHEQLSISHSVTFGKGVAIHTTFYRNRFRRNWYKLDKIITANGDQRIASVLDLPQSHERSLEILRGAQTSMEESLQVKANNRMYKSEGIQSTVYWKLYQDNTTHNFEIGFRLHRDAMDRYQWVDSYLMDDGLMHLLNAGQPGTESNRIEKAMAFSSYLQYHLEAGALSVYPGFRVERVTLSRKNYGKEDPDRIGVDISNRSNTLNAWLPGIGINYQLNDRHRIVGGIHKGFAPSGSNEGAQPEESINYELGWRYHSGTLSIESILFLNDYNNLLGADLGAAGGSGSTDTYNGGEARTHGIEVLLSYDIQPTARSWHVPFMLSYTYTQGVFRSSFDSEFDGWGTVASGDELPYLAPHRLALETGFVHPKVSVHLASRYSDAMRTVAGQGGLVSGESTDGRLVLDMSVHWPVHTQINLYGSVRNLTDATYIVARRPAGIRPGLPRTFELGLEGHF